MGKISDQIREAIRASGTTQYSLAKQIGIPESTISRFMSGKHGLTLGTLDKLGAVLGLEIISTVQSTQKPAPKGRRPKKEESKMIAGNKRTLWHKMFKWKQMALDCAQEAHEQHFSSRRGIWFIDVPGVLCVYNNNPYATAPDLRDKETAEFRKKLKAAGIMELAYATYPPLGAEDAGYTYAMILDAQEDRAQECVTFLQECVKASLNI